MKVTMYYLNKILYAYSDNEDLTRKFEEERNMKLLKKKVVKLSKEEYKEFMNEHRQKMLVSSPYDTTGGYVNLVVTYEEDELVSNEFEIISSTADSLLTFDIEACPFSKKIKKDMKEMVNVLPYGDVKIDCLKVFILLNKGTFIKNNIIDDI